MIQLSEGLILIDIQHAFHDKHWGNRNNFNAENNIEKLLTAFRNKNKHVIHIKHVSMNTSSLFHKSKLQSFIFKPKENEVIIEKLVNSAFIGTNLHSILQSYGIKHFTIVGISLPHCVSTTTRMAQNLGYMVDLIEDATISFDLKNHHGKLLKAQDIHDYNLASLNNEFANIYSTKAYLNEM
ncbi:isochorismatase family protein [Staphylococcus caeli]|uniref:isochorismatase family protein n=1 Tax=Staphylococcus caeli TaxID=2201815 RepID=UPI003F578AA0